MYNPPFLTECRIPESHHPRRIYILPFQYRTEPFQIIRIVRTEYGRNQTFVFKVETEHSVVGNKFPTGRMRPHVVTDITGKSLFPLSAHTQIHGSVKGVQCHIQTAAFHRLLFLFFHRFYRINCFFSFFCGVMEAACFTCRWLSDIRCSGASCL